jgi:hypothetical protein
MNDTYYHLNDENAAAGKLGLPTKQLLTLGREEGWPFRILGQAPMLTEPMRIQDWFLVPALEDSTPLPDATMERLYAIYGNSIHPQGFVLVHEAPLRLTSPVQEKTKPTKTVDFKKIGGAALGFAALTGSVLAGAAIAVVGGLLILPAGLIAAAVIIDPILVAVMPDNTWVEIDRWDTE